LILSRTSKIVATPADMRPSTIGMPNVPVLSEVELLRHAFSQRH
jgi:hypothetical protein